MNDRYESKTLMDAKTWTTITDCEIATSTRMDLYGMGDNLTLEGTLKFRSMNGSDHLDIWLYCNSWEEARDAASDLRAFAEELVMFAARFEDEARSNLATKEKDNG